MTVHELSADVGSLASELRSNWAAHLVRGWGVGLAFLWGLAEGTFFFVVPDLVLSLVSMLEMRRAWRHIVAAVVGAVLGGALMFAWSARDAEAAGSAVAHVPFVTPRMFAEVETSFHQHGISAIFLGPLTGIPYKVYAVHAPTHVGEAAFLTATLPARAGRFIVVWAAFGLVGSWLRRARRWTASRLAILHAGFWIVFYAVYWSVISAG